MQSSLGLIELLECPITIRNPTDPCSGWKIALHVGDQAKIIRTIMFQEVETLKAPLTSSKNGKLDCSSLHIAPSWTHVARMSHKRGSIWHEPNTKQAARDIQLLPQGCPVWVGPMFRLGSFASEVDQPESCTWFGRTGCACPCLQTDLVMLSNSLVMAQRSQLAQRATVVTRNPSICGQGFLPGLSQRSCRNDITVLACLL